MTIPLLSYKNPPSSSHLSVQIEETPNSRNQEMESIPNPSPTLKKLDKNNNTWPRKSNSVMLEGYVESHSDGGDQGSDGGDSSVGRTKSLTDEDLEELKGCLDLGFGFNYEEIPELCTTLPALELCYSMSQRFLDEQRTTTVVVDEAVGDSCSVGSSNAAAPIANWKISSPGDHPEEVKARLKYWAQAVACTVRLCS